ncbi:unnamed protein product [Ascophyllum nodosum]
MYGHILALAKEIKAGIEEAGCECVLLQCPETLPEGVLEKMHAPPKDDTIPEVDVKNLPDADGILFGIPTRFGMAATQVKAVMDATGSLWQTGTLIGKPAGTFFSTGSQGGGQETTALTFMTQLVHHGMIFVPIGCSSPLIFNNEEVHGGSCYGAGTIAGPDGKRMPSDLEKAVAKHQGSFFATTCKALKAGRAATA